MEKFIGGQKNGSNFLCWIKWTQLKGCDKTMFQKKTRYCQEVKKERQE